MYKIQDVADVLETTPQTIRILLQRGQLPFGIAYKKDESNKNYQYILFPEKVREYLGDIRSREREE